MNAKGCNDNLTPNKAKRRPGGGNPSPAKPVKNMSKPMKTYKRVK